MKQNFPKDLELCVKLITIIKRNDFLKFMIEVINTGDLSKLKFVMDNNIFKDNEFFHTLEDFLSDIKEGFYSDYIDDNLILFKTVAMPKNLIKKLVDTINGLNPLNNSGEKIRKDVFPNNFFDTFIKGLLDTIFEGEENRKNLN